MNGYGIFSNSINIGFDDKLVVRFVANPYLVEESNKKYDAKQNKILEDTLFAMLCDHERAYFSAMPELFNRDVYTKQPAFRCQVIVGIMSDLYVDPKFYTFDNYNWETIDKVSDKDSVMENISRFVSDRMFLLDKQCELLSWNITHIEVGAALSGRPNPKKITEMEEKELLYQSKIGILNPISLSLYKIPSFSSNSDSDHEQYIMLTCKVTNSHGASIEGVKIELAKILSDVILFSEYDRVMNFGSTFQESIKHISLEKGCGPFRVLVPKNRDRDKDKHLNLEFRCHISIRLKSGEVVTETGRIFSLSMRYELEEYLNLNNHAEIFNFVSKQISLLDKKCDILSDNIKSIEVIAILPDTWELNPNNIIHLRHEE
jgi:hypothetical protein